MVGTAAVSLGPAFSSSVTAIFIHLLCIKLGGVLMISSVGLRTPNLKRLECGFTVRTMFSIQLILEHPST